MSKPVDRSVSWPEKRSDHVDTCISGPVLAVVGGWGVGLFGNHSLNECWIFDTISKLWSKLPLPESITKRRHYSVSTFQLGPQCVWLVVFGGQRKLAIACTAIVELVQGEDGKWNVGMVTEGAELSNKQEYQDKLAKARAKTKGLPAAVEGGTMTEKQLRQLLNQLHKEKEEAQTHWNRRMEQEKKFLQRKQSVTQTALEKLEQAHHELQETHRQLQEAHRQLQQSHRELQQHCENLQQECQKVHTRKYVSQQISQEQEEQLSWVVNIEEVKMTDKELGRGSYGVVTVAQFRGLRVAAKRIHETIISDYNRKQFTREMNIIAKLRHPNLLLFIGATREGELVILTELMSTSLRKELEKGALTMKTVASISRDVACGLSYLHQWKPHPIIHRDISSPNVLLEPLPNSWRAKLSDYGSANFVNLISRTSNPGNPAYAAPESEFPNKHSPKMDVFSFGVMLAEMYLGEQPETTPEQRESQLQCIKWPPMENLIMRCISETPVDRPSMSEVMHELPTLFPEHLPS